MGQSEKDRQTDGKRVFVTGGARSGKSGFVVAEAEALKGSRAFIATAEPLDSEMMERIQLHSKQRGKGWDTYEEPVYIAGLVRDLSWTYDVIVVDCLTVWLSNMMRLSLEIQDEIGCLIDAIEGVRSDCRVYIVSNEVGSGIVPENELARRFRDLAGMLNRKVAAASDEVYMVVAGIPLKIKG